MSISTPIIFATYQALPAEPDRLRGLEAFFASIDGPLGLATLGLEGGAPAPVAAR